MVVVGIAVYHYSSFVVVVLLVVLVIKVFILVFINILNMTTKLFFQFIIMFIFI